MFKICLQGETVKTGRIKSAAELLSGRFCPKFLCLQGLCTRRFPVTKIGILFLNLLNNSDKTLLRFGEVLQLSVGCSGAARSTDTESV